MTHLVFSPNTQIVVSLSSAITLPMAAKLKIAGTWSGVLEVELEKLTVPMLRQEVANRSNCNPSSINLIFGGRLLKDTDDQNNTNNLKLSELGLKNNSKVLSTQVNVDAGKSFQKELTDVEERRAKLSRLELAAGMLVKRHAEGLLPIEDFNIEMEDQRGQKVKLESESEQRAIMMGLMLHTKGKQLMRKQQYKDALHVLKLGEEAFTLIDTKFVERIDNVPILQIDMVWCCFMLRDINLLALAGERLEVARIGIEHSHGKNASRARKLNRSRSPEMALYLRLELLEGVAAFHCGKLDKCRESLTSAKARFDKDVESAINFLEEEKEKKAKKQEDNIKRQQEIREQKKFGKTPLGKAVDLQIVHYMESIGFERELAAEALRRHENDTQKALDALTNPELNSKIQLDIDSKKRKRQQNHLNSRIEELVSMGFPRLEVISAVNSHGTRTEALNALLAQGQTPGAAVDGSIPSSDPAPRSNAETTENQTSSSSSSSSGERESPSSSQQGIERDVEMENELLEGLQGEDTFEDYDIDVTIEADAINEYLALLDSTADGGGGGGGN
ncbi:uncharacterized protein [Spinacia oleracea]|uniref:Uncharacterized protein isoform X2 n=1 Tax=Spinacia oleracea TaxID=3562 RepID=A0A9R0IQT0_SPIOL|nr:uncharacterized protein LOC110793302 isoform X2 [Spinacia oleracea]